MNELSTPRVRAARFFAVSLRVAALCIAALALCAVSAFAQQVRQHSHPRRGARRSDARRDQHGRRTLRRHRRRQLKSPATSDHTAACPGAHDRIEHSSRRDIRSATVCLLSRRRTRYGLPALRGSVHLDDSAQNWTNTMVRDRAFSHGSDFGARISRAGFDWSEIGENIADGYKTPAGAVTAWMHSRGHCENILNPMFRDVGIGVDTGSAATGWRAGTWTLDFGLLMGRRPPSADWHPAEGCPY